MEENQNNMEDLLLAYYEGQGTEEERARVESWIHESEENHQIARQVGMLCLATDTLKMSEKIDTEKALKKVKRKITVQKRIIRWDWLQRAAAILFLPVLAALLMEYWVHRDNEIQMLEARTSPGMTAKVVLPDSSVVCLNSNSELRYPSSFRGEETRKVELQGEAYFDVYRNPDKKFIVSAPGKTQVEVLGTSFNIEAYQEEPEVTVTLVKGKVVFGYNLSGESKRISLTPGQKVIYDVKNAAAKLDKTSCLVETAWKDGKVIFSNTPLKEALHALEKRYNVKFILSNPHLDGAFTGTFTNQRLETILEYFRISSAIQWRYVDSHDKLNQRTEIEIY